MTNKIQKLSNQAIADLSVKDFNSIKSTFIEEKHTNVDLRIFYKRNKKIFDKKYFWQSELPHFHLEGILESDLKVTFLESYLTDGENCNHELNIHLLAIAQDDYIKHIKLWKAFSHDSFLMSFKQIASYQSQLSDIVKGFEIINKEEKKIKLEEKADSNYFLQFTFGEIVLGFTLYFQALKRDKSTAGNTSYQTSVEVALVNELNNIIALLREKSNMEFKFIDNNALQNEFELYESPHPILGKNSPHLPLDEKYKLLFELISRLLNRKSRKGSIELFLSGYADFESVFLNPAMLKTNTSFRNFKINDLKPQPEEQYFSNIKDDSEVNTNHKTDISTSVKIFGFYGVPDFIGDVDMKKALKLLKTFSTFKGPAERIIISPSQFHIQNKGDKKFIELFGSNESISVFENDHLRKGIADYFNWDQEETKSLLTFLTFDLECDLPPINWVSKPFLKIKNQVLWLGSFLKDRRWDNIILNRLKKEKEHNNVVSVISKNFELKIENLFKQNEFRTISGAKFKSIDGKTGDFDVLAFKDNVLFVCEAKNGVWSNDFIHASYSETVRLEGCAAEQLDKSIDNIREDWEKIKKLLSLPNTNKLESVTLVPLIITNYFEGDLRIYKETIRKISLLELDVILKNKKRDLLESYFKYLLKNNFHNNTFFRNINWDVWGGSKELNAKTIIKIIDDNLIWKEYKSIVNVSDINYSINY